MGNKKRFVILAIPVVLILAACFLFFTRGGSGQQLSIEMPAGSSFKLYEPIPEQEKAYDERRLVWSSSQPKDSVKLKKGTYIYVVDSAGQDRQDVVEKVSLQDEPVHLRVPLVFSDSKLKTIAASRQDALQASYNSKYAPQVTSYYKINQVRAFGDGTWFGLLITGPGPEGDRFVAIARETDGAFRIVTDPPSFFLSSAVYPQIPKEYIIATNKMSENFSPAAEF